MDNTSKVLRRSSLSLSTRLNKKRHSASPQSIVKTAASNNAVNTCESNSRIEVPLSPSIMSICSDGGMFECFTPPRKKIGMCVDDCGDYSPRVFDSSFSPSCLLSQTLAMDSPEVGWKWNRYTAGSKEDSSSSRTPDSAYAADSSFTSASSTEMTNARTRTDTYRQRLVYDARREQQIRKVEKSRADQKLKQRCAKLQEQLKSAGTQKSNSSQINGLEISGNATSTSTVTDTEMTSQTTTSTVKMVSPIKMCENGGETLNDFFNDSDEDCFLLAATQEIESKINAQLQIAPNTEHSKTTELPLKNEIKPKTLSTPTAALESPPTSSVSCPSAKKEKRSSFYMKFLEDDCPDDWFVSLDEVIEQATQSKKPRTSFQRYKSMPLKSEDANDESSVSKGSATSDPILNGNTTDDTFVQSMGMSSSSRSKIKRHSSTHALSPSNGNYRKRQHH